MTKKIKISESDLYNIIKRVLIEQEQEKEVWKTNVDGFLSRLYDVFNGNSEKFSNVHNKHYSEIIIIDSNDLNLSYSDIIKLPDNLKVYTNLILSDNLIEKLPENLYVFGDLYIRDTLIKTLPDNLVVGGVILVHGTPFYDEVWDNLELGELFSEAGFKLRT